MQFTQEQVIQLAPDTASVKAGQKLATTAKWVARHQHEKALWGDCKGSGKNPYRTMVDLTNLAFKCSCPSRKFPCKHSLGLLFLFSSNPTAFDQETTLADHVEEWLSKREVRAEKKVVKESKPVDVKAQQKRADARTQKVEGGLAELRLWLKDVIRSGILNVPNDVYNFSQNITARMVDAQANGLATQLRKIDQIDFYGNGWQKQLTKRLASIYLLTEAYQQQENLPEVLQQEVKTLIGWQTSKEEVLNQEGIQDQWLILSRTLTEEERLQTERVWLYGKNSKRFALLLNFYGFNQLPQHSFLEGATLQAELVAYPGAYPLRMLIKTQQEFSNTFKPITAPDTISSIYETVGQALAISPFVEQVPILLNKMLLVIEEGVWYLQDKGQEVIRLANPSASCWMALAVSKGKAFSCFGIYEETQFTISAIWQGDHYQSLA